MKTDPSSFSDTPKLRELRAHEEERVVQIKRRRRHRLYVQKKRRVERERRTSEREENRGTKRSSRIIWYDSLTAGLSDSVWQRVDDRSFVETPALRKVLHFDRLARQARITLAAEDADIKNGELGRAGRDRMNEVRRDLVRFRDLSKVYLETAKRNGEFLKFVEIVEDEGREEC